MHVEPRYDDQGISKGPERVAALAGEVAKEASHLVRDEIRLIKATLVETWEETVLKFALYAGGSFLLSLGTIYLCIAALRGLEALGLASWTSHLIVAFFLLVAGFLSFLFARGKIGGGLRKHI